MKLPDSQISVEASAALDVLQAQAQAGGPEAQNNLGALLASGNPFPLDYPAATQCFQRAADQGHALAQNNLGLLYANGEGQPKNEAEARKWFRRAANQGDAGGQFNLGIIFHRLSLNTSLPTAQESKIEAFVWLQLAANQGYRNAELACNRLNLQMTSAEVAEGRRRVTGFTACKE